MEKLETRTSMSQNDEVNHQPGKKSLEVTQIVNFGNALAIQDDATLPEIPGVEIQNKIAQGGMGVVYRGRQPYLDRPVAVKVLNLGAFQERQTATERFQREAKILAKLSHPNIVSCYLAGVLDSGEWYIVMEFVKGETLTAFISHTGAIPERQALIVLKALARALGYAYKNGIIHRDIKPENVLIEKVSADESHIDLIEHREFPYLVKLVDLGIARPIGEEEMNVTKSPEIMGTPATMAPEQFTNPEGVDYRVDIYGLGCVLYYMLVGQSAFPQKTLPTILHHKLMEPPPDPQQIRQDLSPATVQLVKELLQKDREDRPQSYDEIVVHIHELLSPTSQGTAQVTPWRGRLALAIGVVMMAGVVLGLMLFAPWRNTPVLPATKTAVQPKQQEPLVPTLPGRTEPVNNSTEPEQKQQSHARQWPIITTEELQKPAIVPAWGSPVSLFRDDYLTRLADWQKSLGQSNWAPSEESKGIVGIGSGRLPRSFGKGPWQIDGAISLINLEFRECGIFLESDQDAAALLIQVFGSKSYYATIATFIGKMSDLPSQRKLGKPRSLSIKDSKEIAYTVANHDRYLSFSVNGSKLGSVSLASPSTTISLYIRNAGAVHFTRLQLQKPIH